MRQRAAPKAQFSKKISWDDHLKLLKEYVAREGHALVPLEHEERGVRLGAWLSRQWSEFQADTRGGYLSRNRKIRLEEAGVVFNGPAPPASGAVGPHSLNECAVATQTWHQLSTSLARVRVSEPWPDPEARACVPSSLPRGAWRAGASGTWTTTRRRWATARQ